MSREYFRPVPSVDPAAGGLPLAGGRVRFDRIEVLARNRAPRIIPAAEAPAELLDRLTAPRPPVAGVSLEVPRLMGIVNVTPDSFSDGGRHFDAAAGIAHGIALADGGADIVDVGGESTRPGAAEVPEAAEIARAIPVIAGITAARPRAVVSVDTRKAAVAERAIAAGAVIINDVSGFDFDPAMPQAARRAAAVCLMHAQGTPETMQDDPRYDDVLLDVFDALEARIARAEAAGIDRARIVADPGIGFGKTLEHNLALLRRISLFHALGVPILLGVSRKRFIGTIGEEPRADARAPGTIAVGLAALSQGVQILRVHDIAEHRQAVRLWQSVTGSSAG